MKSILIKGRIRKRAGRHLAVLVTNAQRLVLQLIMVARETERERPQIPLMAAYLYYNSMSYWVPAGSIRRRAAINLSVDPSLSTLLFPRKTN